MEPILVALDLDKKMRMEVDMLDYTIEEMLLIEYEDKQSVVYLSKSHNKTERNYEIYDKEMLAVIRKLEISIRKY